MPPRESARGWLLLVLGLFLVLFMSVVAINIAPQMLRPGEQVDGTVFTGTKDEARDIFALFAAVIAFGATSTAYGIYIIVTGRQNRVFIGIALAIAAVLYAIAMGIKSSAG